MNRWKFQEGIIKWYQATLISFMDDDSYLTYSASEMPRNTGVYSAPVGDIAESIQFKPKERFQKGIRVFVQSFNVWSSYWQIYGNDMQYNSILY